MIGCYQSSLRGATPSGEVDVNFLVGTDGRAKLIHVVSNTLGRPDLGDCLVRLVGAWSFPPPPGGDFGLTYPFVYDLR